ncbi:MAG: hypothetical protein ABI625_02650 [bacterium]
MTVRIARLSAALLFAAPLAGAPLIAQGVEYAPGISKFRITTATSGSQTTPAGTANFEVGVDEKITVNLMKHAKDTVMATLTLDTISINSAGPKPDLSKLMGAKFISLVSPTGKFYSVKGPEGLDPQLSQITDGVGKFLPVFHANLATGQTWSDTLSGKVTQMGMEMDRTSVSNFKVEGDTTIGGEKAFKIARTMSAKGAGSGNMQGTAVTMEMAGTSAGAFYITPKGAYLGSIAKDDVNIKLTVLAQNMEITIKQIGTTKTEPIK